MTTLYYFLGFAILAIVIFIFALKTAPMMDEEGNLLDKEGNIVDSKGRIIKSVEEVRKEFAENFNKALKKNK